MVGAIASLRIYERAFSGVEIWNASGKTPAFPVSPSREARLETLQTEPHCLAGSPETTSFDVYLAPPPASTGAGGYAEVVTRFSRALRQKDPAIKIIACGGYGYDDGKGSSRDWNRKLLELAAKDFDYLSIHYYHGIMYDQDHVEDPRRYEAYMRDEPGGLIRNSANPAIRIYCSAWGMMDDDRGSGLCTGGILNGLERQGELVAAWSEDGRTLCRKRVLRPSARLRRGSWLLLAAALSAGAFPAKAASAEAEAAQFKIQMADGALCSLQSSRDPFHTEYIQPGARLGDVVIQFRLPGGDWQSVQTASLTNLAAVVKNPAQTECTTRFVITNASKPALIIQLGFKLEAAALTWTIRLQNASGQPLEIGDLALPLAMNSSFQRRRPAVLKHSFISGHGSFLFWMRPDSAGPYLALTPTGDTHFEYWEAQRGYRVFVHSLASGAVARERGTRWRQPHTSRTLAAAGQAGDSCRYGCKFRWADDYEAVRQIRVEEGGVDVQVVPGMTVPADLCAQFALRAQSEIQSVEAEYPAATRLESLGTHGAFRVYQVRFGKLGENRLTIRYGEGRHMYLEFFATEPLETLVRKRAAFIARCQHRDPNKWYNGLLSEWNMESQVLLGPDNYDQIKGWRIYEVSCDDPGLSKPAFLAAKNAEYPLQSEVGALDYYLGHFVWGGLQRTAAESHSYGIYGIPDWKKNRESNDPGRNGRLHLWRVYDYPHVILIYFSMYRVAKHHPHIRTALTAAEYLQRASGTALAMFTVPWEIERWSAYETGFYNELVIVDLIRELERAGLRAEADRLREHWERKVRFFVTQRPDLFRSEYAFDSTGFESTHALARYALRQADAPGRTHFGVSRDAARRFLEVQMAANLFCRGGLEPAYYYLGSDYRGRAGDAYTLSYMSQMGGWAVLDYALHFATNPAPYLRLGYASTLSAWALMNTGTAESNYGYWYPGPANDGAAGGGFEPAPYGRTWLDQPHHRGAWYYACETDLGYCAFLRTAATVLADDPIFGRFCFGGEARLGANRLEVIPRDGLRRRFHALLDAGRLGLVLESDRFAANRPLRLTPDLTEVSFSLESENPAAHQLRLRLSGLKAGQYALTVDDHYSRRFTMRTGEEMEVDIPIDAGPRPCQVAVARQTEGGRP